MEPCWSPSSCPPNIQKRNSFALNVFVFSVVCVFVFVFELYVFLFCVFLFNVFALKGLYILLFVLCVFVFALKGPYKGLITKGP